MINPWIILAAALAFMGGVGSAYFYGHSTGVDSERVAWQARELKATQNADKALANANKKTVDATARYQNIQQKNEVLQHEKQAVVDNTRKQLAASKRLRDPYRIAADCSQLPTTSLAANSTVDNPTSGELSNELDRFLKQQAYEADTVAVYAQTCHEWVTQLQLQRQKDN